ncbi:hypothetical protein [Pseudoblastomonas halimionae]|uniref:Uncharacterized protein n=1 Tax=Alteriqipengyuania halimionae TaxID=1926630 RepID=A0A6I4TZ37_9SPHN|nr:hypothetical protein [Alteriqipengyuania halimionae]MXP08960.1 hypothetical protein [Alteriqipengyuania halimionae]
MELGNPEDRGVDGERLQRFDRFLDNTDFEAGQLATMSICWPRAMVTPCIATTSARCLRMR